jgi:hypothetical protein
MTPIFKVSGTFGVTATPGTPPAAAPASTPPGATLGRRLLDKRYHGALDAAGRGEMLSAVTATAGSAAYVAIECVSGTLQGRSGSFVLQHSGLMDRGAQQLAIHVVPDSATGELGVCAAEIEARVGPDWGRRPGASRRPGWTPGPATQRRMRPEAGPTRRARAIRRAARRCTLVAWPRHAPRVRLARRCESPRRGPRFLPRRLLAGLRGSMGIRIAEGRHHYEFEFTLPA